MFQLENIFSKLCFLEANGVLPIGSRAFPGRKKAREKSSSEPAPPLLPLYTINLLNGGWSRHYSLHRREGGILPRLIDVVLEKESRIYFLSVDKKHGKKTPVAKRNTTSEDNRRACPSA